MQRRKLAAMHLAVCHDSVMAANVVEGGLISYEPIWRWMFFHAPTSMGNGPDTAMLVYQMVNLTV